MVLEPLNDSQAGDPEGARLSVPVTDDAEAAAHLARLAEAGISLAEFSLGAPSLDEVFFALTGREAA